MGRTVPSYRIMLEQEIAEWKRFSNWLCPQDRESFEEMMNTCRLFASQSGAACRLNVVEAMFMATLLSFQKRLKEIQTYLDDLSKATAPK